MTGNRKYVDSDGMLHLAEGEFGQQEGVWFALAPGNHMGNLSKHTVTEHEDGTITVSPSILITDSKTQWHGFLEHGVWRTV